MRIAYVTHYNAADVREWSGIGYYMARSLERQQIDLEFIGSLEVGDQRLFTAKERIYRRLFRKQYSMSREPRLLRTYARQVSSRLAGHGVDAIFCPGTTPIALVESEVPIAFWTDATFDSLVDFHPDFMNLCGETVRNGHRFEAVALERAALAIYSSDWAAESAVRDYGAPRSKVHVVPFGANVDDTPTHGEVEELVAARGMSTCRLLVLASTWLPKGCDVAVEVAEELNRAHIPTELTIVGSQPPTHTALPPFVNCLGFISKSSAEGADRIRRLLEESHFMVLPTRADCTPIAFSEANAFGLPCLTVAIGGIPTIIRNGINGWAFPGESPAAAYASYIADVFGDSGRYRELALSSRNEYETRLNWDVAGRTVAKLLEEVVH